MGEERIEAVRRSLEACWLLIIGVVLLTGCGGSGDHDAPISVGQGLVGIDDRATVALTAPELAVEYALPGVPGTFLALILSDQPTDGDIAFDPFQGSVTITQGPDTLLFGIDSAVPNQPEYRAFLDFPLDGSTGEPAIPVDAIIVSATLTVFVDFVDFAATVPVLLDLVEYSVLIGLVPADYSSVALAVQSFNLFASDTGKDVSIDVSGIFMEAQLRALSDFQLRMLLGP